MKPYSSPRQRIVLSLLPVVFILCCGFEWWMEPSSFHFKKGQAVTINLLTGENFLGEPWDVRKNEVAKLDHATMSGTRSLLPILVEGEKDNITLLLTQEGTQLVGFETVSKRMSMSGYAFREAITEAGLTAPAVTEDSLPVYITRSAKLMLQVGDVSGSAFRTVMGASLEIVPVNNPYLISRGEHMNFRLLFNGKPLGYAQVKVWNRKGDRVLVQKIYTEKDGTMTTPLSNDGTWMVTADQMVPAKIQDAGWQRYETVLVFGFDEP